jgi:hypothetical protein
MSGAPAQRLWSVSLGVAGFLDCSIGLYHSILPYQMQWRSGLTGVPDSLVWALFALNFSWSVLMFLVGCLVLYASRLRLPVDCFVKLTLVACGSFWLIHGTYTWLHPLPLPPSYRALALVLMAFPMVAAGSHWLPLLPRAGRAK